MDSKKVIEKLVKIAENQQKIINKLAQQAGLTPEGQQAGAAGSSTDVSAQVSAILAQIPEAAKAKAGVQSAQLGGGGFLDVKLKFPSVNSMNDPNASAALNKLRAALKAANLTDSSGKPVAVTQSNVLGVYG